MIRQHFFCTERAWTQENQGLGATKEKTLAEGKDIFDFAKFAELYPHDTGSRERLHPDEPDWIRSEYERKYYLDFPDVRTIGEFAELLDSIDESY